MAAHTKPAPPPLRPIACEAQTLAGGLALHRVLAPDAQALVAALHELVGNKASKPRYPGPNPVSLERAALQGIAPERYWVCEKTDGVRYLLMCTTFRGHRVVVLFDRKLAAYLAPLRNVPRALFQGTVVDGEVAFDKVSRRWTYLMFDALMLSGVPVFHKNFSWRLADAALAWRAYTPQPEVDAAVVKIKAFHSLTTLRGFVDRLDAVQAHFAVDGLVLTPEDGDVVYGRHGGMFKFKPFGGAAAHTVDFLVRNRAGEVALLIFDNGAHVPAGRLVTQGPDAHPDAHYPDAHYPDGTVLECRLVDEAAGTWTAVGVRTDKATANDKFTLSKTLLNIRENLTVHDVAAALRV